MSLALALMALGLVVHSGSAAAADQRPELRGVTSIRVANYGSPSTVIKDRAQVDAIVGELRTLRGKAWRRGDIPMTCYATVVLFGGTRTVALFRVKPDIIVERPQGHEKSSYSLEVAEAGWPKINTMLMGIAPAKNCTN